MSLIDFMKDELIKEAVQSYKYTLNIKNLKDLFKYLENWKSDDYVPEFENNKTINIYDSKESIIGTIKDKGKSFEVDGKIAKDKKFLDYLNKGI